MLHDRNRDKSELQFLLSTAELHMLLRKLQELYCIFLQAHRAQPVTENALNVISNSETAEKKNGLFLRLFILFIPSQNGIFDSFCYQQRYSSSP